jgi:signal transduction histidine kinase
MQLLRGNVLQACRHRWCATAVLALITLLIHLAIDNPLHPSAETRTPPWALIPVFLGVLVLNSKQEAFLALLFVCLELIHDINHGIHIADTVLDGIFFRMLMILLVCIWTAHIHNRLEINSKQLQRSEALLMQKLADSLKASALAHELRQPLSQLLLQTRLMQYRFEQQGNTSPSLELAMDEVQSSGRQINRLIEAISSLLRESTPPPQPLDLAMVVRSCLQRLQPQLEATGVQLQQKALEQSWMVIGQATQLQIACCNLISNGLEALSDQPSPRQLSVALNANGDQVELQVADSGPGLPSTQLRDLVMGSTKPKGMGVGLLTVQSIANRHNGQLNLGRSVRLGGAELRLRLPQSKPHPN